MVSQQIIHPENPWYCKYLLFKRFVLNDTDVLPRFADSSASSLESITSVAFGILCVCNLLPGSDDRVFLPAGYSRRTIGDIVIGRTATGEKASRGGVRGRRTISSACIGIAGKGGGTISRITRAKETRPLPRRRRGRKRFWLSGGFFIPGIPEERHAYERYTQEKMKV